jgi:hypothetical protein
LRGRIQFGMIAPNHASLFQRAHPAQAGRGGQPDTLGQRHVGDASFFLQRRED